MNEEEEEEENYRADYKLFCECMDQFGWRKMSFEKFKKAEKADKKFQEEE